MAAPEQLRAGSVDARRPPPSPGTIVLVIGDPIARADIPGLCERLRVLLENSDAVLVVCDVDDLEPDAVTVDALAWLQLTARRLGREICLRQASPALRRLLVLVGLCDVLPLWSDLRLEAGGQAEEREQARGVEEEGGCDDPAR